MRRLALLGVLLAAALPTGIAAPAQAALVDQGSPGKCPPGSYWTHLPTPGATATATGFCKSYVVRPISNGPLPPLPPKFGPHGPPHHPPAPAHFPHHGYPPGSCPPWDHWSPRLGACVAGGIAKPTGNAPLPSPGVHQCPPGTHWHAGIQWAGECRPDPIRPNTLPVIRQPGPVLGVSPAPRPTGVRPLRHR